jgi:hypothetical protein
VHLQCGRCVEAMASYTLAAQLAPPSLPAIKAAALSNLCAAEVKVGGVENLRACVKHAGEALVCYGVLASPPSWALEDVPKEYFSPVIKVLYRRGLAKKSLGDLTGALEDLAFAVTLEPSNEKLVQDVREVKAMLQAKTTPTPAAAGSSASAAPKKAPSVVVVPAPPVPPPTTTSAPSSSPSSSSSSSSPKVALPRAPAAASPSTPSTASPLGGGKPAIPPSPPPPTASSQSPRAQGVASTALAAASAAAAAAAASASTLPPPKTATEFSARVREFKRDPAALVSYLRSALSAPGLLVALFKTNPMDTEVVSPLLAALHSQCSSDAAAIAAGGGGELSKWVVGLLSDMTRTKGFTSMTAMMLDAKEVGFVEAILASAAGGVEGGVLAKVRQEWNLSK